MPYWLMPKESKQGVNFISRTIRHLVNVGGDDAVGVLARQLAVEARPARQIGERRTGAIVRTVIHHDDLVPATGAPDGSATMSKASSGRSIRTISARTRATLLAIRLCTIAVLAFCLMRPVLVVRAVEPHVP